MSFLTERWKRPCVILNAQYVAWSFPRQRLNELVKNIWRFSFRVVVWKNHGVGEKFLWILADGVVAYFTFQSRQMSAWCVGWCEHIAFLN